MDILDIDVNSLTLGEIEVIEEKTGRSIDEAFKSGAPRARLLRAIAFVVRRRTDPSFRWEDTESLTLSDVGLTSEDVDPIDASAR